MFLYYMFCFTERKRSYRIFLCMLYIVIMSIYSTIQYVVVERFHIEAMSNWYSLKYIPAFTISMSIFGLLCYVISFFLERKNIRDINPLTILIIAPSFLYLYLLTVTTYYFSVLKDNLFLTIVCILSIVGSLLASIFAIRLSNSLKNKEILEQKLDFMEQYGKLSEDYSSMVEGNLMEMRKIRHDFNNAIQVIQAMIVQNNLEEATQLSEQLQNEYTALSNQEFCENITINTILQQEQRNCEKNNIALHVSCKVPKELPVLQVDLCSILTNLLHNAERAVLEIPENTELKRRISLSVWIEGDMLMFRITNPNKNPIIEKNGKLVTTKTDKKNHGLGMEIIRQIAIQYNGDVHIEHDDSNFTVLVMLGLVNTSSN